MLTVPLLLALMWLVTSTRQGKAMRATSQDMEAAVMMGINVNRTISFTFALAGSLAGAAGLIYVLQFTTIRFDQAWPWADRVHRGRAGRHRQPRGRRSRRRPDRPHRGVQRRPRLALTPGANWTRAIVFAVLIAVLVFRPEAPRRADAGGGVTQ